MHSTYYYAPLYQVTVTVTVYLEDISIPDHRWEQYNITQIDLFNVLQLTLVFSRTLSVTFVSFIILFIVQLFCQHNNVYMDVNASDICFNEKENWAYIKKNSYVGKPYTEGKQN